MMLKNNRFSKKLDKVFWFILFLLPLISYFIMYFSTGVTFDFADYVVKWSFPFISDIFDNVFANANFDGIIIIDYLSYCVGVEIAHCLFDVAVFIPRLAHKFISKAVQDE